jgi:hypothetical protein
MATITLIPFLQCFTAVATDPPPLPAKTPSSNAKSFSHSSASASLLPQCGSTFEESKILGKYSCGHFLIPGICEPSLGCAPTI